MLIELFAYDVSATLFRPLTVTLNTWCPAIAPIFLRPRSVTSTGVPLLAAIAGSTAPADQPGIALSCTQTPWTSAIGELAPAPMFRTVRRKVTAASPGPHGFANK